MNDPLDPKLRDFEKRLRTLRPLEVNLPSPKPKQRRYFRNVFSASSVAVVLVVVAIVFFGFREQPTAEQPGPVAVTVDMVSPTELPEFLETPIFSTVRSQLVTLLNELPPVAAEPARREDYPVIEITVTKTASEPRDEFSGILRGGSRIDFDPEKPFLF